MSPNGAHRKAATSIGDLSVPTGRPLRITLSRELINHWSERFFGRDCARCRKILNSPAGRKGLAQLLTCRNWRQVCTVYCLQVVRR